VLIYKDLFIKLFKSLAPGRAAGGTSCGSRTRNGWGIALYVVGMWIRLARNDDN